MSQKNLYSLSYKDLIYFSVPSVLSSLFEPLASVVDTAFVGHLSTDWLAALAICSIIFGSLTWIFNFIVHTSTQAISGAYACGDLKILQAQIKVSLIVSLLVGLFAFVFMSMFKPLLFELAATSEQIYPYVDEYYSVRLLFHPALILFVTLVALLRGLGKVKASFFIIAVTTLLNIILTWIFLYLFKTGISGAAWATSIANVLGVMIAAITLFAPKQMREGFFTAITLKTQWFHFGKNSIHLFGRSLTLSSVFFLSTRIAGSFGTQGLAAYQIAMQIWLLASFLTDGLAITANVYVAHFQELRQHNKILESSRRLLVLSLYIGAALTVIYWFFQSPLWMVFTEDTTLFSLLAATWALIAFSQLPNAITYTLDGIMFGLGSFSFLRTHIMLAALLIFLPLAAYAQYYKEAYYLWLGLILLNLYRGLSSSFYLYRRGLL